jgi:adenylate cyclase
MNKTSIIRQLLSFLLLALFLAHASNMVQIPLLATLERKAYDYRINLNHATEPDERIVIVDIDEKSLAEIGRWPWNRDVLATLVDNLYDHYDVAVTGFDVLFAEADTSSGLNVLEDMASKELRDNPQYLQALEERRASLKYDELFAQSLQERNVILGYFFTNNSGIEAIKPSSDDDLPDPIYLLDEQTRDIPFIQTSGYGANLPILQANAAHGGFIDLPTVDDDGVIRAIPVVQRHGDRLYESLSMAMVRSLLDFEPLQLQIAEYQGEGSNLGLEKMSIGDFHVPVDERGVALVPYRGPYGSFPYVSAADVLNKTASMDTLEDAIILVGATAAGLLDVRSTPVQALYPGVEVHANLIAGILDSNIKENPAYVKGMLIIFLIVIWLMATLVFYFNNMLFSIISISSLLASTYFGGIYAWTDLNIVLPMATPLTFISLLFMYFLSYSYFVENRSKRQLARMFRQYIPPELVDELDGEVSDYGMEGETREMSVMFSDIRGFTSISEKLPPKELTRLMNAYLTGMTTAIQQERGTIDKYIGDAIMAFWGAPIADEKHAQRALEGSMEMLAQLETMQEEFDRQGWPPISIGVGINSGPMFVGNIGSEFRMSYTVLGDAVNLGARLE